jgi:hypothetical protein
MNVKNAFLNGRISEIVYVEQPPVLKIQRSQIMFINSLKLFMISSKLLELGMKDLETFLFLRDSILGRLTLHCSLNLLEKTCLFVKFMLVMLSLVLLIKVFVRNFVRLCLGI